MIPDIQPKPQTWKTALAAAHRDIQALAGKLGLTRQQCRAAQGGHKDFPILVPSAWLKLIARGDPDDPLLRQVLPGKEETTSTPGYSCDPVGDLDSMVVPGLLHKYHGRVLLVVAGGCAINCRYCFRRHFPYRNAQLSQNLGPALAYISKHPEISEVILSGGDPLLLSTPRLAQLAADLAALPHIQRIRLHTRMPVVLPERIDATLLDWLRRLELPIVMVVHCNHAREIDARAQGALMALHAAGCTLLNQSVLLQGVNDRVQVLADLSERLFACHVLPYYLHQLDRVSGAAHFSVDDDDAQLLMHGLRGRLPGYLVPKLVRELAGAECKQEVVRNPPTGI